jgi:hypothetical protein
MANPYARLSGRLSGRLRIDWKGLTEVVVASENPVYILNYSI